MPPIADTKDSRLRFLDLDPLLAEIRGPEGTAWVPESARVLRSGAYQFLDEPYIEQVIVAKYGCPEMYDNGLNFGGQNVSRASWCERFNSNHGGSSGGLGSGSRSGAASDLAVARSLARR